MTRRTAIVHVGVEKTGSTAIQHWLVTNRARLLDCGILVPTRIGSPNHTKLVVACLDDGVIDNIKGHLLARDGLSERKLRDGVARSLARELDATPGWDRVVITSELISSRLHSPSEIERLVSFLRRHVDDIHFVIFLRRQDELALSRFSSALRAGHADFDGVFADLSGNSFPTLPAGRSVDDALEFFDYERIISRFTAIADARLTVLSYDPPGGSPGPVRAFCDILGQPAGDETAIPVLNSALSAEAQFVISQLNRHNRVQLPNGERNEPYRALLRRIEAEVAGERRTVPRAEAEAFLARYAASNARVADAWFPQGRPFREGFGRYPETVDYGPMMARMRPELERWQAEAAAIAETPEPAPGFGRALRRVLSFAGWTR